MKPLIFLGDIHGEWLSTSIKIEQLGIKNSYIIQVGDFGIGFRHKLNEEAALHRLNECLLENGIEMFIIRGNHDDPKFFTAKNNPYGCSNIAFLPDYSELEVGGKKILLVGGAVSIDRIYRQENKSWWSGETMSFNDRFDYKKYDVVVTHTRPIESGIYHSKNGIGAFLNEDKLLSSDIDKENAEMSKLYQKVKTAKIWVFGHFHDSLSTKVENTHFKLLGVDEFWELPNYEQAN